MRSHSDLDGKLLDQLLTLEDDLQDAAEADPSMMKAFIERLSNLQFIVSQGIACNSISAKTLGMIRSITSNGVILADHYLNVNRAHAAVEQRRNAQLLNAFSRLSLKETDTPVTFGKGSSESSPIIPKPSLQSGRFPTSPFKTPSTRTSSSSSSNCDPDVIPPHIPLAYDWLLKHIYNPYPSSAVKSRIAAESGVSSKIVSEWFVNVRRRIGWTRISKEHFKGKRALTVDCARAVFLGDPKNMEVTNSTRNSLYKMKITAETLFDGKLETSDVAKQLDKLVRDVSGAQHASSIHRTKRRREREDNDLYESDASSSKESSYNVIHQGMGSYRRSYSKELDETVSSHDIIASGRPMKRARSSSSSDDTNISSSRQSTIEPTTPCTGSVSLDGDSRQCLDNEPLPFDLDPFPRKRNLLDSEEIYAPRQKRLRVDYSPELHLQPQVLEPYPDLQTLHWADNIADLSNIWPTFDFTMPSNATLGEDLLQGDLNLSVFDVSTIPCVSTTTNVDIGGISEAEVQNQFASSGEDFHQFLELLESSDTSTADLGNTGEFGIAPFDGEPCTTKGTPDLCKDAELLSTDELQQLPMCSSLSEFGHLNSIGQTPPLSSFFGADTVTAEFDSELYPLLNSVYTPEGLTSASECDAYVANLLAF